LPRAKLLFHPAEWVALVSLSTDRYVPSNPIRRFHRCNISDRRRASSRSQRFSARIGTTSLQSPGTCSEKAILRRDRHRASSSSCRTLSVSIERTVPSGARPVSGLLRGLWMAPGIERGFLPDPHERSNQLQPESHRRCHSVFAQLANFGCTTSQLRASNLQRSPPIYIAEGAQDQ